jgi:glucose-1-phosphate cytidylyltransferase
MKVVLFCGGAGMRLRGYADDVPKPMVEIGTRPILWHLMKYYAPLWAQGLHYLSWAQR